MTDWCVDLLDRGQTGVGSSIAYCAAKAGIDVMTKSLARVLAPAVRVLGVAPGVVDTGFVPGRSPEFNAKTAASHPAAPRRHAEDVAEAVLACATTLRFSTGTTLVVDGGRSLVRVPRILRSRVSSSPAPSPATSTTPDQTPHLPITPVQIADAAWAPPRRVPPSPTSTCATRRPAGRRWRSTYTVTSSSASVRGTRS